MNIKVVLLLIPLLSAGLGQSFAAPASSAHPATGDISAASTKFLATLDDAQRGKVVFDFKDSAQRARWSNFPTSFVKRGGLRLGDLTKPQRDAALAVVAAALSPRGYEKAMQIAEADEALKKSTGATIFGRDNYYISFLGHPSATEPWMIQFGGHHLGLNITLAGARGTLAPSHVGVQPARYQLEGKTVRPLGREADKAFALLTSLDAAQRKQRFWASRSATSCWGRAATAR
jgi:hypothetical protein